MPFAIVQVPDSSHNKTSGIRKGDIIVALNDVNTKYADEVKPALEKFKGQQVEATVLRDGSDISIPLTVSNESKLGLVYSSGATPETLKQKNMIFLNPFQLDYIRQKKKFHLI